MRSLKPHIYVHYMLMSGLFIIFAVQIFWHIIAEAKTEKQVGVELCGKMSYDSWNLLSGQNMGICSTGQIVSDKIFLLYSRFYTVDVLLVAAGKVFLIRTIIFSFHLTSQISIL